jgi:predicted SAM-dependent methyltransferase
VRLFVLRAVRRLLKDVDVAIERKRHGIARVDHGGNGRTADVERFLRSVQLENNGASVYLEHHLSRLVRSLALVPACEGGRALELGTYGYVAAALERVLGYAEVRGAYYGDTPGRDRKTLRIAGQAEFAFDVDLFDAERHGYPYGDASFDVVLCCELIEHLLVDPMHMLFECHRVLADGGLLVLTTPNAASFTSVACTLHGWRNPQVYSLYPATGRGGPPHVREYTAREVADAMKAAGFELEALFTERIAGVDEGSWVKALLEREGLDTSLRGEQTYCLARKRPGLPAAQERYPSWLYAG